MKNPSFDINEFISNNDKNILTIKSSRAFFTAIRIYQASINQFENVNFIFTNLKQYHLNISKIIENIESNDQKSILILEIDQEFTENIMQCLNNNSKLILISEFKSFEKFEKHFEKINSQIVYQEDKKYGYDDLTDDSKLKLLDSEVLFQNNLIKFKDLLGVEKIDEVSDDLKSTIDLDIFNKLVKISPNEQDDDQIDIYIERTFYRFIKIDHKIFKENKNDIIAILDSYKLNKTNLKWIKFNEIDSDKLALDEIKVIILSSNKTTSSDEFELLRKNNRFMDKNMHLLDYDEKGDLVWCKTYGNIELIKKHTLYSEKSKINLVENYFCNLNELNEQIIVISDEAGMGKSTLMTNLSRNLNNNAKNSCVLKVDLNKYFKQLRAYKQNKRSIEFLCALNIFKTDLEKYLLKRFSSKKMKLKLVVLFDGLDEISPYYKEAVLDIVDDLKQMNAQIVITTRPHLKEELENHYGVISYQLTKFNHENQKNYLISYWKLNCANISRNDIEKKAEAVLKKIANSINDRERDLTGIPLQLKLFSEIYSSEFNKEDELNLKLLYEKFVQKKFFDVYCIEKKRIDLNDPEIEEDYTNISLIHSLKSMRN